MIKFHSSTSCGRIPQFDGAFSGLTRLGASAWYNSLQVRFQKRATHYISFEGNYTFSKATDNSSAGANSFITNSLSSGIPQVYDNLKAENSISANDATHRFVIATICRCSGRKKPLDWPGHESRVSMASSAAGRSLPSSPSRPARRSASLWPARNLADGNQRPNVICGAACLRYQLPSGRCQWPGHRQRSKS